jgi:hypothetical protein
MTEESRVIRCYEYTLRNWNALLAAVSLIGVAIFSIVPALEQYTRVFIFLAANAIVWTLIELKVQLFRAKAPQTELYTDVRAARRSIIEDVKKSLQHTSLHAPLTLTLIGCGLRTMGDIVRETAMDLQLQVTRGHLIVDLYCFDPAYIASRVLPGAVPVDEQKRRMAAFARFAESVIAELANLAGEFGPSSSFRLNITLYSGDPFCTAYLIGDKSLYWTPVTWASLTSEFIGPENPCLVVRSSSEAFAPLQEWIRTRAELFRERADASSPETESIIKAAHGYGDTAPGGA